MGCDFDLIVIGSGSGGGAFAYACARAGKRVLLLERGPPQPVPAAHDEQAMLIDKQPYDDRPVLVNGSMRQLYMGGVLGGGSSLYGAVLLRPSRDDFHPGRHYGSRLPRSLWDWPIDYPALESYYAQAEQLFGVSGSADDDFGTLEKPRAGYPQAALPLKPINQKLVAGCRARGLKPFRLPLAIDFEQCWQCDVCPGYVCPTGARRSSAQLVEQAGLSLHLRTNVHVEQFARDGQGRVDGVVAVDRATRQRTVYRARRYGLAAGAIGSPLLLLRSGLTHPLIGRNYMMHVCPVAVGLFPRATGADETFVKQLGFADFYHGRAGYEHKLGLIQSLPVPGPKMIAKSSWPRLPGPLLRFLRRRMLPLTGIVEDLPAPENRVCWTDEGKPALHHRFSAYDLERGREQGRLMSRILKYAGAVHCVVKSFPSNEHVAHQCGTLRFGSSPAQAVADEACRLFEQPNVFVVDGSVLPTSLGVGPALTIMANALRVADIAVREL